MEELGNVIENKGDRKKIFYITTSVLFIICLLVIYFQNRSLRSEEENYSKSMEQMSLDIKMLKAESKYCLKIVK